MSRVHTIQYTVIPVGISYSAAISSLRPPSMRRVRLRSTSIYIYFYTFHLAAEVLTLTLSLFVFIYVCTETYARQDDTHTHTHAVSARIGRHRTHDVTQLTAAFTAVGPMRGCGYRS